MYQELVKQKIDLSLRKPFKQETNMKIKKLNERDYIYGTMLLDGTNLSRQEIEGMMEGEIPRTASLKDCVFIKNYLNALEFMRDALAMKTTLDKRMLLKLHALLVGEMTGFRRSNSTIGEFRHVPPNHTEIESKLSQLLQRAYKTGANEIRSAARIHCGIIDIYPFEKHSEVIARMAMNYYLEEKGFLPVALGYNRQEYIKTVTECLKDQDVTIFFWGLERAEYNKQDLVRQIVESDEADDETDDEA